MAVALFLRTLAEARAVQIPARLEQAKRAVFIERVRAAVKLQAGLARQSDALLRVREDIKVVGEQILIPHEPAAALNPRAILGPDQHPDIQTLWWLSAAAIRALQALEPKRQVHGGIQPGSFVIDWTGRVKLADLGLVACFEAACGPDARRYVACEVPEEGQAGEPPIAARWMLLEEHEFRECGWIAPYFSHEVLSGEGQPSLSADQFSLGAVLFQIATGKHPYGAELSDPTLAFFLYLEPLPLCEERRDWAAIFERGSKDAALRADKPVLDWAALVSRMLASDSGGRFDSLSKAEPLLKEHAAPKWAEAAAMLGEAYELLEQQQFDPLLTTLGQWCEDEALPELWRSCLVHSIERIEQLKAEEEALRGVRALLQEAGEALERLQPDAARGLVRRALESPRVTGALRAQAEELLRQCDLTEQTIGSRADEKIANEYLAQAREALERDQLDSAEELLKALLGEAFTPAAARAEAHGALRQIEQRRARLRGAEEALRAAAGEFEQRQYGRALRRLEALAEEDLPAELRRRRGELIQNVQAAEARRAEYEEALAKLEAAAEAGELEQAEAGLQELALDSSEPDLLERRGALGERIEALRSARDRLQRAQALFGQEQYDAALAGLREVLAVGGLPQALHRQATELHEACLVRMEQIRAEQLRTAAEALRNAQAAFEACDAERCLALLKPIGALAAQLAPLQRQLVERLPKLCEKLGQALKVADAVEKALAARDAAKAGAECGRIDLRDLPSKLAERVNRLRARADALAQELHAQRIRSVEEKLDHLAAALNGGELDPARSLLAAAEPDASLTAELRKRYAELHGVYESLASVGQALGGIRDALKKQAASSAARLLDELQQKLKADKRPPPRWVGERVDQARKLVAEALENARRLAGERAAAALKDAEAALGRCDVAAAQTRLAESEEDIQLASELRPRLKQLRTLATQIAEWTPKVNQLEAELQNQDLAQAAGQITALEQRGGFPGPIAARLSQLRARVDAAVAEYRAQLTTRLEALAAELAQKGRAARRFRERAASVSADPLAAPEHQARAGELVAQFEALPPVESRAGLWIGVAAAAVLLVGVGAYLVWPRHKPEPTPEPGAGPIQVDPRERIAAALEAFLRSYAQAVATARQMQRQTPGWTFTFDPPDKLPTSLVAAESSSNQRFVLPEAENLGEGDLDGLSALLAPGSPTFNELFPPAEPTDAELLAAAWPAELAAGTWKADEAPSRLRAALGILLPQAQRTAAKSGIDLLCAVATEVTIQEHEATGAFAVQLRLDGVSDALTAEFAMGQAGQTWNPEAGNAATFQNVLESAVAAGAALVTKAAAQTRENRGQGALAAAWTTVEGVGAWRSRLRGLQPPNDAAMAAIAELEGVEKTLYPPAAELLGNLAPLPPVPAAATDAQTGYPSELRDATGRTLRLVNVPPADPLWDAIQATAARSRWSNQAEAVGAELVDVAKKDARERPWVLLYLDASARPTNATGFKDAAADVAHQKLALPTRSEWLLAALKLLTTPPTSNPGLDRALLDGTWDWCAADESGAATPWACGGTGELDVALLTALGYPQDLADFQKLWDYLNHPLVCQPRDFADGLMSLRAVWRPPQP